MYSLSRIRRHARREAHSGYNPWGRASPRRAVTDVEAGDNESNGEPIHASQTAPDYPTSAFNPNPRNQKLTQRPRRISEDGEDVVSEEPEPETKETIGDESKDESNDAETEDEKEKPKGFKGWYKKLFVDDHIPAMQQLRTVLFPRWLTINWLLLAAPVGIGLHFTKVNPLAIFIVNFIAIIPLAAMLSNATEELALRVGEVLGGLLNASFGNAVELIVGVIALTKKEIIIVQTSLIGSMLSNLLLVLGMCFFFGGVNRVEQFFNTTVAQTAASLLALSVGSLIIPTAYTWGINFDPSQSSNDEELSRGTAIILLFVYCAYLFFQLKSHRAQYNEPSKKVEKRKRKKNKNVKHALAHMGARASAQSGQTDIYSNAPKQEEEEETPSLSLVGALVTLCGATALIGICAEFLVDSINDVTCQYKVSQYFVGLVLLPIVGNAAEHATAVTVAIRDKMDLAIGVAVGSSMQIALFVLPLMIVIGWGIHSDMTLLFDDFQIAVLFVSIVLVNYLIADGKSHWLEGVLLMALYIIIAIAAWFYPRSNTSSCPAGGS